MRYLRKNTAVIITVGPFLDYQDGVSLETALTVTSCNVTIILDDDDGSAPNTILNTAPTATGGSNDMVHIANGLYSLELTQAQTNYNGRYLVMITDPDVHLPVWHEFMILDAQVYDSLVAGSDLLDVNTSQVGGTTQTAVDIGGTGVPITGDLTSTMKTSVNTEVNDVLAVDTHAEPGQGAMPLPATLKQMLQYLYKALRNKSQQTSTETRIFNDDGATVDHKASINDDGTTLTKGEIQSGP